ncbi:bifunctional demethylmenaquinone methyltransferase/2-methoxy-6-polyprenyl-1,4-benzoquinol methylase UbiE [Solemya velum gill symbiont]|uniref:bifunctional demethylmenaquinone methyltransferase/2-methoxy-6-polyprenyl-1,4-benzoquinol methylase UbiE n=1 Tax=Solemya velum gill symbiont TaxID=2340 RepID=UPI0009981290|nr:bifunctional demethylmenaquinone methyltransferase/2-methoxy-6-polyprenyl-1,4-benzoquinol methylase UbiE [Solemya velum gill symbiont]OOZ46010.1 bifunctional demethylmenaquinone methyltransferase/2-methoxy-6-polyprenyl-1,4-benzoquinol methylase [Solemya velum gill symbiont]OOZ47674.1 bifunctional demethylmenaquinone methyltransferase/2-methoxy-6-polyprenyl-1,4-benzoquinol methylase [Solemya velum gill symbiont]OOZ50073.1 bifunctional demethylmenaquinone methyltransferase/2-methoxy-6-polypreny
MNSDKTTHFGFETVKAEEKADRVREVFDSVASNYDIMNDLMSLGVHRLWKHVAIDLSAVRNGQHVLDLASGTGDLASRFAGLVGPEGRVVMSDINLAMLEEGRKRMVDSGHVGNVEYLQINAEEIPFPDNSFDCVTIGFGLRNVTDKDKALREMFRVIKPGGRVLVLEFSKPVNKPLEKIYDFYSFKALPLMGKLVAKDADSYRYLAESIRMHPDQETLKQMIEDAGFERCDYHNLTGGVVAIHRGFKL